MNVTYSAAGRSYAFRVGDAATLPELARQIESELSRRHPALKSDESLAERVRDHLLDSLASNRDAIELGVLSETPIDPPRPRRKSRRGHRPPCKHVPEPDVLQPVGTQYAPGQARSDDQTAGFWGFFLGLFSPERRQMVWRLSQRAWRFFVKDCEDLAQDAQRIGRGSRKAIPQVVSTIGQLIYGGLTCLQIGVGVGATWALVSAEGDAGAFLFLMMPLFVWTIGKFKEIFK